MEEFRAWLTLGIAVVALILPGAIWAWSNFIRRGIIDIHETWAIEVGFSSYGPTIGLNGTLQAVHHDRFVRSIDLIVTRIKDSSRYGFEWLVFRPASVSYGGVQQEVSMEVPAGFLLTTAQPRRYNITFSDRVRQAEMTPHLQGLSETWQDRILDRFPDPQWLQQQNIDWATFVRTEYSEFQKDETIGTDTYTAIDRLFYWEPGDYSLEMCVNTTRPNAPFRRTWRFSLMDVDTANLRQNVIKTVMMACQQDAGAVNFAYAQYHPSS